MQVPLQYFYGVDIAIKKLRPNATYEINNNVFTKWNCPDSVSAPSWEEINTQVEQDKAEYERYVKEQGDK